MSKKKCTLRAKLKAVNQEERIHMCKEHFKNQLGNSPKVTNKPITKIIDSQQNIELEQFTHELNEVLRKIKI